MAKINVLDHGFVKLVEISPNLATESRILECARVSYSTGEPKKGTAKGDLGLLTFLMRNKHMSPFEMVEVTFHISAPIFVKNQFVRHRTAMMNEMSLRYVKESENIRFNMLKCPGALRTNNGVINKQNSRLMKEDEISPELMSVIEESQEMLDKLHENYEKMCDLGLCREIARSVLSVGHYTHFYWKMNLRNLLHFFDLRCDEKHAQYEIVQFANAMKALITEYVPNVIRISDELQNSNTIFMDEIDYFTGKKSTSEIESVSRRNEIEEKIKLYNLSKSSNS